MGEPLAVRAGSSAAAFALRRRPRVLAPFFRRNPLAVAALVLLALLVGGAVFAPWLSPANPTAVDIAVRLQPPSPAHPLGTDFFGRDLLSRILYGGRATLSVAAVVIGLAFGVGVPVGLVAGTAGGKVDGLLMRLVDAFLAFPALVLAIALASALGPSLQNAMLAVAIAMAPQFARVARGQALAIRGMAYVEAARAAGVAPARLVWRHVLPNGIGPLVVQATLNLGSAILATASLGFLGLGAQTPTAEWGADVAANTPYLREAPWAALAPGAAIMAAVLASNLVGDAVVDWLNPRTRRV